MVAADGSVTGSFALSTAGVDLIDLDGVMRWHLALPSAESPRLVAEGDFTGDGRPDGVFRITRTESGKRCGSYSMTSTQLVLVDGADGRFWTPLPASEDICWNGFGSVPPYATRQWGTGTAYVGDFAGVHGLVIAFPYYADTGTVLRFNGSDFTVLSGTAVADLVYPSTPRYDLTYDSNNAAPCSIPYPPGPCFIPNAHVPNAVFTGDGLFVLTSARAFLYRADFAPTSDLTWLSGGRLDNGGRNYGLVTTLADGSIALIGGCSVFNTRQEMRNGGISNTDCSVHRHYEWFRLDSGRIVAHASRYYGYVTTDGAMENRIEYPLHAAAAITGRPAALFNLYRRGTWAIELQSDPSRPDQVEELEHWFAWDAVPLSGDGRWAVLASRVGTSAGAEPVTPEWGFDVLAWEGGHFESRAHFDGLVPSLFAYPTSPGLHASDGMPYGVLAAPNSVAVAVLVEDRAGHRRFVDLPSWPAIPGSAPVP